MAWTRSFRKILEKQIIDSYFVFIEKINTN